MRPLQAYLSQNKTNRVKLSEQAKLAFFQLKEIISLQTKLFYYTKGDPTDASDYGVGGYLYQLIENPSPSLVSHLLDPNSVGQQYKKKLILSSTPFVNSNIY